MKYMYIYIMFVRERAGEVTRGEVYRVDYIIDYIYRLYVYTQDAG